MNRRAARARLSGAPVDVPAVPVRLLRCEVEDWVPPHEVAAVRASLSTTFVNGRLAADDEGQVAQAVKIRAFRLHRAARRAWAAELGIDHRDLSGICPTTRPGYRDYAAFARRAGLTDSPHNPPPTAA